LTNENGSHSDFSYDALDRLVQQGGFDGRTQRYHYDLTGKLTQSEDEGLVTLWYYDESDRITHRTVNGEPAEQWQYDDHGWLTDISHLSEGHRVAVHYGYDDKGRLTGERQTVENPETGELLWQHETTHAYNEQGLANRVTPDSLPPVEWLTYGSGYLALISEDGNTAWRGEYDEWGNQLNEENPYYLHQPYRLPGQQHDEESGLYYNRNRYYDPLQGRYITQDPIGLAGGWNLYNYPLNPIIRMDPLGLYNLYQLLYDVWHDDSYGTSSIDITGSGDLISLGGHAGLGVAFAKKKGEMLSDICIYATACGHAGIGGGINAAITYSETKSLPTSGVSNSVGVTVGGGVGGHFAYTYVVDVDNPESSTESVGIGAGVDASVMTLACRTWQECWVN
ncbi:RHS repeat-associated core domain-containing protein, partial [Escherichia coli]|nr:RHS repeat protein [Escherichia coli]